MRLKTLWFATLLCFSFLLLPKDVWHHCEAHHDKVNSSETSLHQSDNDCDICDFKLFQLNHVVAKQSVCLTYFVKPSLTLVDDQTNATRFSQFNKGPPNSSLI